MRIDIDDYLSSIALSPEKKGGGGEEEESGFCFKWKSKGRRKKEMRRNERV